MSFLTSLLEHFKMNLNDLDARRAAGSFDLLTTPYDLPEFQNVIKRIEEAKAKKEKTVIYGDYDVDGLTSTAILKLALDEFGLKPGYFIPSRYKEGYGLNSERVKEFKDKGYQLLITVDNGISAFEPIKLAKSFGMDVIIIDHHEVCEKLPDTCFIFHQFLSKFINYNCSAASLAFFVASFLLKRNDDYLATLAGIAVFSDVMPLEKNNLNLAKIALKNLNLYRYKNLVSLIGVKDEYEFEDLSFSLIPALNAPGRISKETLATIDCCKLLIARNDDKLIAKYAPKILNSNQERKDLVKNVAFVPQKELTSDHGAVLYTEEYSGLSGLFANKEMRQRKVPLAVFSPDEKDPEILNGSLRALEGYQVDVFLKKNQNLFLSSGGHEKAAGLRIKKKDYFKVATLFLSECEKQALEIKKADEDQIPIVLEDLNADNYLTLQEFEPFGEGFPAPIFALSGAKEDVVFSKNGNAAMIYSKDKSSKVVYFGSIEPFKDSRYHFFTFIGSFKKETYKNVSSYSLISNEIISEL